MSVFRLVFTQEAKEGVADAVRYYNGQLPGLGKRFKTEVRRQLLQLKQNPLTHIVRYENIRLAALNKFPYSIHYTVHNQDVIVYLIISDFRNPPQYWVKKDGE